MRRSDLRRIAPLVFVLATLPAASCRQDMHDQARLEPLEASDFFADGRGSRVPPSGTVARGELREDSLMYRGLEPDGGPARTLPVPVTRELLESGRFRYDAFCSPCHDRAGTGRGMVVQRGFKQPPSLHIERLRTAPVGYYFNVISNGFGQMSGYAAQIPERQRWAIIAYIRALQLSQDAGPAVLGAEDLNALPELPPAPPPSADQEGEG